MDVVFLLNGKVFFILSVRNQYVTEYYIFCLNSDGPLNPFQALCAFVSVIKWVIPTVLIQLLIANHPQISASNRTGWL